MSEAWQGYESKAYGVSNHNLKLQSKKLSRTRDIPNFPTQGWADTALNTRNWSETYRSGLLLKDTFYGERQRFMAWLISQEKRPCNC